MNVKDNDIKDLLSQYKKLAVYGLSPDTEKPSYSVPHYIRTKGWEVVGIYPKPHAEGGFKIYSNLNELPAEFKKFLVVFRSSEKVPEVVDEVLNTSGIEVLWLQLGISNAEAETRAELAGLKVVSNRCLVIEHKKWFR